MKHILTCFLTLLSLTVCAQPVMKVDSIVFLTGYVKQVVVYFDYDSNGRVIAQHYGEGENKIEYEYDGNGLLTKEITKGYTMVLSSRMGKPYISTTSYEYDTNGNLLLKYDTNSLEEEYALTDRTEYTYDSRNHRTSMTEYQFRGKNLRFSVKYEYEYTKHGVLKSRNRVENQGSRFWKGDEIVDVGERWKAVCHDLCDKNGNIIFHRNYDTNDTTRYEYLDGNQLSRCMTTNEGNVRSRMEYSYDRNGNPVRADRFYATMYGSDKINHAVTYDIYYNLDLKAEDVCGLEHALSIVEEMGNFRRDEIDYAPRLVNAPTKIYQSSPTFSHDDKLVAHFFYSPLK